MDFNFQEAKAVHGNTLNVNFFALADDFEADFQQSTILLHLFVSTLKIKLSSHSDNLCN